MIFKVYAIYDCKMEEFSEPFIQRENAVERSVANILSRSSVPKDDLSLYELGSWDSENGVLDCWNKPVFIETDVLGPLPQILVEKEIV